MSPTASNGAQVVTETGVRGDASGKSESCRSVSRAGNAVDVGHESTSTADLEGENEAAMERQRKETNARITRRIIELRSDREWPK